MNYRIDQLLSEPKQSPEHRHGVYYTLGILHQALSEHASQDWVRRELYWTYGSATNADTELAQAVAETIGAIGEDYPAMSEQELADYTAHLHTLLTTSEAKQARKDVNRLYALRAYKHEHKER